MKLFIVTMTGSYAVQVEIHRAKSQADLEKTLKPLAEDWPFNERQIVELSLKGEAGLVYSQGYIE